MRHGVDGLAASVPILDGANTPLPFEAAAEPREAGPAASRRRRPRTIQAKGMLPPLLLVVALACGAPPRVPAVEDERAPEPANAGEPAPATGPGAQLFARVRAVTARVGDIGPPAPRPGFVGGVRYPEAWLAPDEARGGR